MAARRDVDVAILGGGLAGLSLAVRLAAIPGLSAVVIEPRPEYRRDRTWCCWRLHGHPFGEAVAHRWHRWEVTRSAGAGTRTAAQTDGALAYEMIPADRLYEVALARIAAAPSIEVRLGVTATAVREEPDGVTVETSGGTIRAGLVFDSRPPPAQPGGLVQAFLGQEVETEGDCFDPGTVTLMDFAVAQRPGAVRFLYVLPTSPRHALVEDTWLAPGDMILPDHRTAIRDYLRERFGVAAFRVGFEEAGAIPMSPGLQAPARAGRVVPIGTAGGAIKPSSGYGFLAIQRAADAIAADLAAGRRPAPVQTRTRREIWMDRVFLSALRHAPESAPAIFHALFARTAPGPLLRFLNDLGGWGDTARVIAATPKAPMIAAALRPW